ncbi:MAG TPA: Ku protein [Vicinamibacterales bacterium]|nr:Ku protein [Vicinamibacterales bacterium]
MALRPTWKGTLRLSLISVPIRVFAATTADADVSFHQVHRKCKTRIQLRKWCPHCKRQVERDEIVKGHERGDGKYVLVEEEDIAALRPSSTRVVEITDVVSASAIDPVLVERAYFLAPENKAAGASFAVLRDALDTQAAVGRVAVHGREYLAAIVRRDAALMMYTLRTEGEVRQAREVAELKLAGGTVKAAELKLARQVLASFETGAELESFTDNYQKSLKAMLAKRKATEVEDAEEADAAPRKVVNLMDALRESLAQAGKKPRTKPASKSAKSARVLRHSSSRSRRKAS